VSLLTVISEKVKCHSLLLTELTLDRMLNEMTAKGFSRILVPIDESASSIMAEETAAKIAKNTNVKVTVLHIWPESGPIYGLPSNVQEELDGSVEQRTGSLLNDARAVFNEEKVEIDTETLHGDPADNIVRYSKENSDLIVIGGRGESEKEIYTLGSVTKKVLMYTRCPILIVKKASTVSSLLVCVDASDNSMQALHFALEIAEKMGSKITLLNVQERRIYDLSRKTAEDLGEKSLSRALDAIGKKINVEKKLEFGSTSDKIVEVAEKGNCDLIVLGRRGLGTVERLLLGSVSDGVSNKAKCSVLIVPKKS